ncbi:hypothetical protein TWF696_007740 [Orbilia brochopaga]|uniref:Uncharacterized protein n=1 Tax=Orbilia brochopaga TaxID=3140254 RepID=A0AAV9UL13_9PEZI
MPRSAEPTSTGFAPRRRGRLAIHSHRSGRNTRIYVRPGAPYPAVDSTTSTDTQGTNPTDNEPDPDFASDAFWEGRNPPPSAWPSSLRPRFDDVLDGDTPDEWELNVTSSEDRDGVDSDSDSDNEAMGYTTVTDGDLRTWCGQLVRGLGSRPSAYDVWEDPSSIPLLSQSIRPAGVAGGRRPRAYFVAGTQLLAQELRAQDEEEEEEELDEMDVDVRVSADFETLTFREGGG